VPKVLARTGHSLADIYDVKGSIAGVEELLAREVSLVHEMGQTIFSERLSTTIRHRATDPLAASTAIAEIVADFPAAPTRILGVTVLTDNAARLARVSVHLEDPLAERGMPIWVWDGTNNQTIDILDNGAISAEQMLTPTAEFQKIPNFRIGSDQPQFVENVSMRGVTTAFGAGDVTITMMVYIAFAETGNVPSSFGLPVPGW